MATTSQKDNGHNEVPSSQIICHTYITQNFTFKRNILQKIKISLCRVIKGIRLPGQRVGVKGRLPLKGCRVEPHPETNSASYPLPPSHENPSREN